MGWNRITKDDPCPVCGREKYCMVNDNGSAVLCTKEPSDHPVGDAGWLHVLDPKRNLVEYRPSKFEQLFAVYQQNVIGGMSEFLAQSLNVTAKSIEALGIGFYPLEHAWVWAEMDELGNVTGLLKRYANGKKVMEKGSERGLIYQYPLSDNGKPIIVVEGASDCLAAMDMGYVAVGRPSADGGGKLLSALLKGRDVIIVGENDGTVGVSGMEKMAQLLKTSCKTVRKVLPPPKCKDLRVWHPTAVEFEQWASQYAETVEASRIIEEINMLELAEQWMREVYEPNGKRLFHWLHGDWYRHNGTHYEQVDDRQLDRELYEYFNQFTVVEQRGKDTKCNRLNPRQRFICDLKHALGAAAFVRVPKGVFEPFLIGSGEHIDVTRAIVFCNGLLDAETGILRPLTPDIFVTSTLPYDYNAKARYDLWLGFVMDVFNGDQQCHDLLQEWFGYNLIASNHMQQMLFLFGVPGSGKSTTINVLSAMLGPERVCPVNLEDFTDRFGLEQLVGKYAAILTEDRAANRIDADRVLQKLKKITGQDMISVQRKYRDAIHVRFFSRFTYAGNELPKFHDEPGAMMRRFNLLWFPNNYYLSDKGPDRNLEAKLRMEIQGVANWAMVGLRRLLSVGHFTEPDACKEHLQDFHELSSPLSAMIDEYCEIGGGPEFWATIDSLWELHRAVYEQSGLSPMGQALFKSRIKTVMPELERTRKTVAGEQVYVYTGIRIKQSAQRKFLGRP